MTKSTKNYQLMSSELDTILAALQAPDVTLDQALELYEKGQKVIIELEKYLKTAENKIRKINRVEANV